jgi:hypothetical protein
MPATPVWNNCNGLCGTLNFAKATYLAVFRISCNWNVISFIPFENIDETYIHAYFTFIA